MSKYGELTIEESEENVQGRMEPSKKCVIKSSRKVLGVGLGESKSEARHSASIQVMRQMRKNCYTIQAKESYFKEGKATPYDLNPDPKKDHVYRLARQKFKNRFSMIKFVDNFAKNVCSTEVIFGDDFPCEDREAILKHCKLINLNYRFFKCQSTGKMMHTHIAVFHQQPLPVIKADLMKSGGENDKYRLINPGCIIPQQSSTDQPSNEDMWPDTVGDEKKQPAVNMACKTNESPNLNGLLSRMQTNPMASQALSINFGDGGDIDNFTPSICLVNQNNLNFEPVTVMGVNANKTSLVLSDLQHNMTLENLQFVPVSPMMNYMPVQEMSFGPQPLNVPMQPVSLLDMPLQFGHPSMYNVPMQQPVMPQTVFVPEAIALNTVHPQDSEIDLRDELVRRRQSENAPRGSSERKVYDMSVERRVLQRDGDSSDAWSRKVFVAETEKGNEESTSKSKIEKLLYRLKYPPLSSKKSPDRSNRIPVRDNKRKRQRTTPERNRRSPSPRDRSPRDRLQDNKMFRDRRVSPGSRSPDFSPDRSRRRSPTPERFRDDVRLHRSPSPVMDIRDLWPNVPQSCAKSVFMLKYVLQDSTTERDPFNLLRATRSLAYNMDFEIMSWQISIDKWYVGVEMVAPEAKINCLVGEGRARTKSEARLIAAYHAIDTVQKACRVIQPNSGYFADGGVPDFILKKNPRKTPVYEIMQNLDPNTPLDRQTLELIMGMFLTTYVEDLFFLATDFSYHERILVIETASQMNLHWRLFGPRHSDAPPDDVVSTQHVCVFKQKAAQELVKELLANGGSSVKYTLVDPRESRITLPSNWLRREMVR